LRLLSSSAASPSILNGMRYTHYNILSVPLNALLAAAAAQCVCNIRRRVHQPPCADKKEATAVRNKELRQCRKLNASMTMRFGLDMMDTLPEPLQQIGHWRYKNNCTSVRSCFPHNQFLSLSPPRLIKALAIFTAGEEERYYSKGSPPPLRQPAQPIKARSLSLHGLAQSRPTPMVEPPHWNGGGTNQLCQTISFCIHRVTDGNLECFSYCWRRTTR